MTTLVFNNISGYKWKRSHIHNVMMCWNAKTVAESHNYTGFDILSMSSVKKPIHWHAHFEFESKPTIANSFFSIQVRWGVTSLNDCTTDWNFTWQTKWVRNISFILL